MKLEKLEKKIHKLEMYEKVAEEADKQCADSKNPDAAGGPARGASSKKVQKKLDKADMLKKIYEAQTTRECDPETGLTYKQMKKQWKLEKKKLKHKHHNHTWFGRAHMVLGGLSCAVGGMAIGFMTQHGKTGAGLWGGVLMIIAGAFARRRYKSINFKRLYIGLSGISFLCALLMVIFGGQDGHSDILRIQAENAALHNMTTTAAPTTTTTTAHLINGSAVQNGSTTDAPVTYAASDWPFQIRYPTMAYVRVLISFLTMAVGISSVMVFAKSAKTTLQAPVGPWPDPEPSQQQPMYNLSPAHKAKRGHLGLPPAYTPTLEEQ